MHNIQSIRSPLQSSPLTLPAFNSESLPTEDNPQIDYFNVHVNAQIQLENHNEHSSNRSYLFSPVNSITTQSSTNSNINTTHVNMNVMNVTHVVNNECNNKYLIMGAILLVSLLLLPSIGFMIYFSSRR